MSRPKSVWVRFLLSLLCLAGTTLFSLLCSLLFLTPLTEWAAAATEEVLRVVLPDLLATDFWGKVSSLVLPQAGPFVLALGLVVLEMALFSHHRWVGALAALATSCVVAWSPFQDTVPNVGALVGGIGCLVLVVLWKWARARFPKVLNRETIRYVVFGVLTTVVSFLSQMLFSNLAHWPVVASTVGSWVCAVLFAYVVNKLFVFESHTRGFAALMREMGMFIGARLLSLGVEVLFMAVTVEVLHWSEAVCKVAVQVIILILNYILSKRIIFKK